MTKYYNKLVRDKIPEIISNSGSLPLYHYATSEEYYRLLCKKLIEEISEFIESDSLEELADICEVVESILKYKGVTHGIFKEIVENKRNKNGSFNDRIILEGVENGNL